MNVSEVNGLNCILGVGGDVEIEQQPAGQNPDGEDGVEHVAVDVAVHDTEHHPVLPGLGRSVEESARGDAGEGDGRV